LSESDEKQRKLLIAGANRLAILCPHDGVEEGEL